jgi:NADH:ubiquinone oxidoreductase subunit D
MSDIFEHITDSKSALAKLASKVPGLAEFLERNDRRAADKLLRETLARRVEEQYSRIGGLQQDMMSGEGLLLLDDMERAQTNLTTFADSIRAASYGYAGLFAKVKINEEELAKIYEYDSGLFENVQNIATALDNVRAAIDAGEGLRAAVRELNTSATAAMDAFRRREDVILSQ